MFLFFDIIYVCYLYCFHYDESRTFLPQRIVSIIERCGAAFIKLGQWLSLRSDIFDSNIIDALTKLQENINPHNENWTNKCILEIPSHLHVERLCAVGSIGQVYKGRFHNKEVAIKILHPNIKNKLWVQVIIIRCIK